LLNNFFSIWKPGVYHGAGKTRDYFEGWYFKCVSREERAALAVIPGVSITAEAKRSHAFVMVADASSQKAHYFRFPLSEFRAHPKKFEIRIGPNIFSLERLGLDLADGTFRIQADLSFGRPRPWPVRLFSPGVMGWYAFVPFMECYHGVLSFDHGIAGGISTDGSAMDMTGGKGYIEKDWGVSMPSSWIWMQSNHFEEDGVSLFGSVAKIPWRKSWFTGYIFGLLYKGKIFRFTTYTGARLGRLDVTPEKVAVRIEGRKHALDIEADRREGVELAAPSLGDMTAKVRETLRSKIRIRFSERKRGSDHLLFAGIGRSAGLEFVGRVEELLPPSRFSQ
jgi:tocopherol cyclase